MEDSRTGQDDPFTRQVNPALPPPVRTNICPENNERAEGVWGCSLAEAAATMERFGYVLVQLDYSDAM